jgi:acetoin utilization protein AcuB
MLQTEIKREGGRSSMRIAHVMTPDPIAVGPDASLATVRSLMDAWKFRRVLITEHGKLLGIVTDRDLREHNGYLESTKVTAAMRSDLITITPNQTAEDAARLMIAHKIGGLPVMEGDAVVGILTATDLLKAFVRIASATAHIVDNSSAVAILIHLTPSVRKDSIMRSRASSHDDG